MALSDGTIVHADGRIVLPERETHSRQLGMDIQHMQEVLAASRVFQSVHLFRQAVDRLEARGLARLPKAYSTYRLPPQRGAIGWSRDSRKLLPHHLRLEFESYTDGLWAYPTPGETNEPEVVPFGSPIVLLVPDTTRISSTGMPRTPNNGAHVFVAARAARLGLQWEHAVFDVGSDEGAFEHLASPSLSAAVSADYWEQFFHSLERSRDDAISHENALALAALSEQDDSLKEARAEYERIVKSMKARRRWKPYRLNQRNLDHLIANIPDYYPTENIYPIRLMPSAATRSARRLEPSDVTEQLQPSCYGVALALPTSDQAEAKATARSLLTPLNSDGPIHWEALVGPASGLSRNFGEESKTIIVLGKHGAPWELYWEHLSPGGAISNLPAWNWVELVRSDG